jgi:YVTN family beta-propeller protein
VTPIDIATNTPGPPITVGSDPYGIAITPNGQTAYVTNEGDDTVTPIDIATNTPGSAIIIGLSPQAIAITPDQAPAAAFNVTPGPAGTTTAFDASFSSSPLGAISSYGWNFGDRSSPFVTSSPTTTHTYASGGTYDVTLTVTNSQGTSTSQVFTGQTVSNNGGASATTSQSVTVAAAVVVGSSGYDLVGRNGGVFVFPTGAAGGFHGSLPGLGIHVSNIVGMEPTNGYDGYDGYDLVGSDGGVFVFPTGAGNGFYGSLPGLGLTPAGSGGDHPLDAPIVGIAPTADDHGYLLVGADGGVFRFGDVPFLGSLPGEGIHVDDIIGIALAPSDAGYWLMGANGTVYPIGNVANYGSRLSTSSPVSGITATSDGGGYWIVTQNGSVYSYGDAATHFHGSLPGLRVSPAHPVIGLVPTISGTGYWLIGSDGGIFAFPSSTPYFGSLPGFGISVSDIVGAAPTRLG